MSDIGELVQYKPFESEEEKEIYIDVSELDDEEIRKINKTEIDKTKIKIRIAEKFRLENVNIHSFEGFKINEKN